MKKKINLGKVLIASCMLSGLTLGSAIASDITGVTPTGNTYNIEATKVSGDTGFRQYTNFNLDNGDIANLQYNNYQNFVNLVDNQVNINGIVNTMQGNNFYNGHAIFVSPQGMVVGASGVLNVGSLSTLTPSSSQFNTFKNNYNTDNLSNYVVGASGYQGLIQDSQGNIVVNGKIIAREAVNLYGSNITIQKTAQDSSNTGIVAGYTGTSPITQLSDAEAIFNSLVSNKLSNANSMQLDSKGNITLVANKAVTLTKDDDVSGKLSDTVSTSINIDKAVLASGNAINASANSNYEVTTTIDKVSSALSLPRIISGEQSILSLIGAELNEYFEGTRATSTIDVLNSQIYSINGTSLASNAVAKFTVTTPDDGNASKLIYALGTETLSRVNLQASTIEAGGDFIAKAFSENVSDLTLKNTYLYNTSTQESTNANSLMLVNQTAKSTTTSTSDASNVKAKNVSLISRNYNSDKLNIDTDINPDNQTGFAINAIFKNQQIDTTSEVKNNSTITSAGGTVDVTSQNLSVIQNDIDLLISKSAETRTMTVEQTDADNVNKTTDELQQQLTRVTEESTSDSDHGKNAADKITGNQPSPNSNTPMLTSSGSGSSGSYQIGGSLILNRSIINTTSQANSSSITGAINTYVTANAVDLTSNVAETLTEGATSFATGLAVTVDLTEKNTLAQVLNGSTINSNGLFVNATTELPLNADALKLVIKNSGVTDSVTLSTDVSSSEWDLNGTDTWIGTGEQEDDYTATGSNSTEVKLQTDLDTDVSYEKFFHNIAKSTSTGSGTTTLSGSFVYNTLLQNTEAKIENSTIETTSDIGLNAVNSVTNYSAAGAVDFILSYLQEDGSEIMPASSSGKYTIGGAVLINFLENNANALIDNSNITTSGNINLTSSNEQSYISGSAMGAKGTSVAIEGSVVVETADGSTNAKITNSNNINAGAVNVIAGQGMLNSAIRENYVPVLNSDTGLIKLNATPRTSDDKFMNVVISGAVMSDGSGSDNSTAIGASVNVINLDRSLNSTIENSVISALNAVNVNSQTYLQGVNVAIAGTFEGGVSTDKDYQFNANTGSGETNGAQAFANYGGWINDLDSVVGDNSTFDTDTDKYEQTTADATESTVLNALKGTSTQDALTSTTSKVVTEEQYVYDSDGNIVTDPLNNDEPLTQQVTVTYQPEYDSASGKYVYKNSDGEVLLDSSGNPVEVTEGTEATDLSTELADLSASSNTDNSNGGLLMASGSNSGSTLTGDTATSTSGKSNFGITVAGSVNVYNNTTTINSNVSNSTITTGGEFNLIADQSNELLNNANCETKAGKVGVGGAVNVSNFHETTQAILEQSTINKANTYEVNIKASDYNKVTDQATGSGSAKSSSGSAAVAIGGSINVAVDESFVKASSLNSAINNASNVSVISNNYIDIYSNAGLTGTEKTSGAGVGIGIAGNINILKDTSIAEINGSTNIDAGNLYVIANDKGTQTNNIKSVAMSAGIMTGGSSASFMLEGSFGTDIIEDTITAQILNASEINATGDIKVDANSDLKVVNLDGSVSFSTASAGAGVGFGAIVEVYDNNINTRIQDTNIYSSNSVDISSAYDKELRFIAANLGIITSANATVNVNGIVNVIQDKINSYITNSNITTAGNLNFSATHNIDEIGITIVGNGAKAAAIGGNAVVNILEANSEVIADKNSSISAGGDITVSDYIEECINVDTAGVTASQSATAIAATVDVNLITNSTKALFSADVLQSNSLTVNATDLTTETAERNLLVSATGGAVGLGGVVTIDIVEKAVQAKISDAENISSTGTISVNAKSDNAFGAKKKDATTYYETEIGSIAAIIDADNTTEYMSNSETVAYWQYAINGSGATVGINETVVVKDINNNISATIENADIKQAGGVEVTVNDYTINNALLGDVVGSKTVSVGGAEYINVLTSNVAAKILSGTKINSTGDIVVSATNREVLRDILIAAGGAGTVTINGDASVNVLENTTEAIIDQNVSISNADNISVTVSNSDDAEAADVSASGSATAQIGGIFKFNQFESQTNAKVGAANAIQTKINSAGDIDISANEEEVFSAMMYTAGGSGTAAIDGIAVVNIFNSNTNSIVDNSAITTTAGKIDVTASHDYNPQEDGQTVSANMLAWMQTNETASEKETSEYISDFQNQVAQGKFAPLVSSLDIEGSGVATITGNITSNNFDSVVTAKVDNNSVISSLNGLNVDADQTLTTFDAMAGVSGSGVVDIIVNGVVNVINDKTNAFVNNSTVTAGGAFVQATESMNINSAQFGIGGAGATAILTAVDVNVIDNATKAYITNSNITGGAKTDAEATSYINNFFVIAGGSGCASVMLEPAVNYYIGSATGYIDNAKINGGENLASGITDFTTNNLLAAGSLAITGATVNALAIVNDLIYNTEGYITNSEITNAISTAVVADCSNNMYGFGASLAITITGAAIPATGIVNDYHNTQNAYIKDTSIEGGTVTANAINSVIANTCNGTVGFTAIGGAVEAVGLVNYFITNTNAYLYNLAATNVTDTTVSATSTEDLKNNNFSVGIGVVGGTINACALVNVLENSTKAYIDAQDSNYSSTGAMNVHATDNYLLYSISGIVSGGAGDIGANVNVNEVNNTVNAYVDGKSCIVEAGSINVESDSIIGMEHEADSIAVGIGNITGNVVVSMIGGDVNFSSIETSQADLYSTLNDAVSYEKNTITALGYDVRMSSSNERGSIATLGGNVKAENDINVTATNKLKGYENSDDTYRSSNATISAAIGEVSAGVHYAEMKYNTKAAIEFSDVTSETGNITLTTDNYLKGKTDILTITAGIGTLDGAVAYFLSNALTQSYINNSSITAGGTLNIDSKTYSNFVSNAEKDSVSGVDYLLSIVDADDQSKVYSKIVGDNNNITAKNINITSTAGADLSTDLDANVITALKITTVFNSVNSNIDSQALIEAINANINVDNMTIATKNSGIRLVNTYHSNSFSAVSANADEQGSFGGVTFKSGITNPSDSTNCVNISGYADADDFADSINIYNNVSTSDNTVAGTIYTEVIEDQNSISGIDGAGMVHDAKSDLSAITLIQSGSGTIKTDDMNISSLADRTAKIMSSTGKVGLGISVNVYTINTNTAGSNTVTFSGNNIIADTLDIALNDNNNVYTQITNNNITLLVNVNPVTVGSNANVNTDVTLSDYLTAENININTDVNRYAYASADMCGGSLIQVSVIDLTAQASGNTSLNISQKTPDGYDYSNNMNINNNSTNTSETYYTSSTGGFVDVANAHCNNNLNATTSLNIENADINSTGDINIGVTSNNIIIRKQDSAVYGVVVVASSDNVNTANNSTSLTIKDSTIDANNINLSATSHFGDPNAPMQTYSGYGGGFVAQDWTSITTNITQNTNLSILGKSILTATNAFTANVNSNSDFKAKMLTDTDGFVAGGAPNSKINANNTNTFLNDVDSTIAAEYAYINMNSSNNLQAEAWNYVDGFSGTCDANPNAQVTLNVTNQVDNKGKIETGNTAQIDFMTGSINNLKQYTYAEIDAAMPFGGVEGSVSSTIKNQLNVPSGASIISDQDVIGNFMEGTMNIDSKSEDNITCRMLFGIPIDCSDDPKYTYYRTLTNGMSFDGQIVAQAGNQKYLEIDRDGKIAQSFGFSKDAYNYIEGIGTIAGEQLKEKMLESLQTVDTSLKAYKDSLNAEITANDEQIDEAQEEYNYNKAQLDYLNAHNYIAGKVDDDQKTTVPNVETEMDTNIRASAVQPDGGTDENKITETQYADMIEYMKGVYSEEKKELTKEKFFEELNNYMDAQQYSEKQQETVTNAVNAEINKITAVDDLLRPEVSDQVYHEYSGDTIISESARNSRIEYLENANVALNQEMSDLEQKNIDLANSISLVDSKITKIEYQIEYIQGTSFSDTVISDSAYVFEDISSASGAIQLNNIQNYNISGNGTFILPDSAVQIENYSDSALVFKSIYNTEASDGGNLVINGRNFNDADHTNTENEVNCKNNVHYGYGHGPHLTTSYEMEGVPEIREGITIRNYFDNNDPVFGNHKAQSDIMFTGAVSSYTNLYIWNESGSIAFSNTIDAVGTEIYATQGNILVNNDELDFVVQEGDIFYAGKNITFNINSLVNDGLISAGRNERKLTITDEMLKAENLIADPSTGDTNMINIGMDDDNNSPSPYLNTEKDNIKALYKDGKILVFGFSDEGGKFKAVHNDGTGAINVEPTGSGKIVTTSGYSDIKITNNTSSDIVIYNVKNNYMEESTLIAQSQPRTVKDYATTTILSANAAITLDGLIQNGYKSNDETGKGTLDIEGKTLTINYNDSQMGNAIKAYNSDASKNALILKTQSGMDIAGCIVGVGGVQIDNSNIATSSFTDGIVMRDTATITSTGMLNITNSGNAGININGNLVNNGNTTITNNSASDIISSALIQSTGDMLITNSDGEIISNGNISGDGEFNITSTNGKGITINGNISNDNGNTTLLNGATGKANTKGICVSSGLYNDSGNISITSFADAISLSTINGQGTLDIMNYGNSSINLNGNISSAGAMNITHNNGSIISAADATINNTEGTGITISSNKFTTNGDLSITNGLTGKTNNAGIKITSPFSNKGGNISISNYAKGIEVNGFDTQGHINISNNGDGDTILNNNMTNIGSMGVYSYTSGDIIANSIINNTENITIQNNNGNIITNGNITNGGDLTFTNKKGDTTINGSVNNGGDFEIGATEGDVTLNGAITNGGNFTITAADGSLTTNRIIENALNLEMTSASGDGITITGNIINKNGDIIITNGTAPLTFTPFMAMLGSSLGAEPETKGIKITSSIYERGGDTIITNYNDGIYFNNYDGVGKLEITNNGDLGLILDGNAKNVGTTKITNSAKSLTLTQTGKINSTGVLDIDNSGVLGINVAGQIESKGLIDIDNTGIGGIDIVGSINNVGISHIITDDGVINIAETGKVLNTGNGQLLIENTNGSGINIAGEVKNEEHVINIINGAEENADNAGGIIIADTALIQSSADTVTKQLGNSIDIINYGIQGITIHGTISSLGNGNMKILNKNDSEDAYGIRMFPDAVIQNAQGDLIISNEGKQGGVTLLGTIDVPMGDIIIKDSSEIRHGITINEIQKQSGDIILYNEGAGEQKGITILGQLRTDDGNIVIYNEDANLTFGLGAFHLSDDDGYLVVNNGNIYITQRNGNIVNTIVDTETRPHSNYDMATDVSDTRYRTLIVAKGAENGNGNVILTVTDGDIGVINGNVGDINADNIDFMDSINVNIEGSLTVYARNKDKTDDRVVNIRAKQSDLNIASVIVEGDAILSAPDWRQADNVDPSTDSTYYTGYSIFSDTSRIRSGIIAKNLTLIASNTIGSAEHPIDYIQRKVNGVGGVAAFEAENNIYLRSAAFKGDDILVDEFINELQKHLKDGVEIGSFDVDSPIQGDAVNVNQLITKQGSLDLKFFTGANIEHLASAGGDIALTLGGTTYIDTIGAEDNLTITQTTGDLLIRTIGNDNGSEIIFNDILYPHDKIRLTDNGGIPQTIDIEVNGDDSDLIIYNAYVKGANNGACAYNEDGSRKTDVKLSANTIVASATDIPASSVGTKKNPNGFVLTLPENTVGIRSYGNGNSLALELTGKNDSIAENIVASVNSNNLNSRGVILNKLYSDDAYINTVDTRLTVNDGYINNYAEIRNGYGTAYDNKLTIVDNDFQRLIYSRRDPASVQLYTTLSGNFDLGMDETIKLTTNAPVLHYNPYMLVNKYSDYNSFYNAGMKETSVQQNFVKHKKDMETTMPAIDNTYLVTFDVAVDAELVSNVKILKISRTGASIENDGTMKVRKVIPVNIKFKDDDIDVTVNAKVERIENGIAEVRFVDMPENIANQIMYRCYKKANAKKKNDELTLNVK